MAIDQQVGGGAGAIDDALLDRQPELPLDGGEINSNTETGIEITTGEATKAPAEPQQGDPLAEMRATLESERRARAAATQQAEQERRARIQAENYAVAAQVQTATTQRDLIANEVRSTERFGEQLEAQLAAALQQQDTVSAAKLQRELSKVEAKLLWLNDGLVQIDERAAQAAEMVQQQPQRPAQVAPANDAFEQAIAALAPESQQWLRRNPQYIQDASLHQRLIQAHHVAEYEGYQANTPSYFQAIEAKLGLRPGAPSGAPSAPGRAQGGAPGAPGRAQSPQNGPARVPTVAAPVGRSAGITSNPSNPGKLTVRLTPVEVQIAKDLGMTAEEYAKGKIAANRRNQQGVM